MILAPNFTHMYRLYVGTMKGKKWDTMTLEKVVSLCYILNQPYLSYYNSGMCVYPSISNEKLRALVTFTHWAQLSKKIITELRLIQNASIKFFFHLVVNMFKEKVSNEASGIDF